MNTKRECRICGTQRALTRHRLVPGSLGGQYTPRENVVLLCADHHSKIDRKHPEKKELRRKLRRKLTDKEIAHIVAAQGERWLSRNYPADLGGPSGGLSSLLPECGEIHLAATDEERRAWRAR